MLVAKANKSGETLGERTVWGRRREAGQAAEAAEDAFGHAPVRGAGAARTGGGEAEGDGAGSGQQRPGAPAQVSCARHCRSHRCPPVVPPPPPRQPPREEGERQARRTPKSLCSRPLEPAHGGLWDFVHTLNF